MCTKYTEIETDCKVLVQTVTAVTDILSHSGDIIELPLEEPTVMMENATASMDPVPVQYQDPREITLSGSGSQMLLYFYSDLGSERPGFEIAYW